MAGYKNVAIRMDPDRYRQLRLTVVEKSRSLQSVITEAIEEWLERHSQEDENRRRRAIHDAKGLYASLAPGRSLSEELLVERRREAENE